MENNIISGPFSFQKIKPNGFKILWLEILMFKKYPTLRWQYRLLEKKADFKTIKEVSLYHLHLEWLLKQGENRETKVFCPHCRKGEIVQYFSYERIDDRPVVSRENIFCSDCSKGERNLKEFKFSTLADTDFYIHKVQNYTWNIYKLFKYVFNIPKDANQDILFQFFKEENEKEKKEDKENKIVLKDLARKKPDQFKEPAYVNKLKEYQISLFS